MLSCMGHLSCIIMHHAYIINIIITNKKGALNIRAPLITNVSIQCQRHSLQNVDHTFIYKENSDGLNLRLALPVGDIAHEHNDHGQAGLLTGR